MGKSGLKLISSCRLQLPIELRVPDQLAIGIWQLKISQLEIH